MIVKNTSGGILNIYQIDGQRNLCSYLKLKVKNHQNLAVQLKIVIHKIGKQQLKLKTNNLERKYFLSKIHILHHNTN